MSTIHLLICWQSKLQSGEQERRWYRIHPKRPEIIGREDRNICGRSGGDPLCGVHQSIRVDHPYWWRVCVLLTYVQSGIFLASLNSACRWSKRSAKQNIYCPLPILLLLRWRPSFGVWNTEGDGTRKGHAEWEAKPSQSALMTWPAVLSPSISALRPPLDVAS